MKGNDWSIEYCIKKPGQLHGFVRSVRVNETQGKCIRDLCTNGQQTHTIVGKQLYFSGRPLTSDYIGEGFELVTDGYPVLVSPDGERHFLVK